jgi:hypothetical protein
MNVGRYDDGSPLRAIGGQLVPVAGLWVIDPSHSSLAFEAPHMWSPACGVDSGRLPGSSTLRRSRRTPGWRCRSQPRASTPPTRQLTRAFAATKFLDVERFPTLHYRSREIRHVEGNRWQVDGSLTIRDLSRAITLDTTFEGAVAAGRAARAKAAFIAHGETATGASTTPRSQTGDICGHRLTVWVDRPRRDLDHPPHRWSYPTHWRRVKLKARALSE